jgi:DNA-binding MarR family transcriptional regulator
MEALPLARLLSATTRMVIEEMHERLRALGHPDLRPAYGYALNAVGRGDTTTAQLAAELGMTKQGAAKLVASLEQLGYLDRQQHAGDGRAQLLKLTPKGDDLLRQSARVQRELEREWEALVGAPEMAALRDALERLVAARGGERRPPLRPIW